MFEWANVGKGAPFFSGWQAPQTSELRDMLTAIENEKGVTKGWSVRETNKKKNLAKLAENGEAKPCAQTA